MSGLLPLFSSCIRFVFHGLPFSSRKRFGIFLILADIRIHLDILLLTGKSKKQGKIWQGVAGKMKEKETSLSALILGHIIPIRYKILGW